MVGVKIGATVTSKFTLIVFLITSRLFHKNKIQYKKFKIRINGKCVDLELSSRFGDAHVLVEVFGRGVDYVSHSLESPKIIFDLGANIGLTALYFKTLYPDSAIYCFEPDAENYGLLQKNIVQFSNVYAYNMAISGREETRTFYKSPSFHMRNSLISRGEKGEEVVVKCISLQSAMILAGVSSVDFLKFDIEGAEFEVFSSFNGWHNIHEISGELHPYVWKNNEDKILIENFEKNYSVNVVTRGSKVFLSGLKKV